MNIKVTPEQDRLSFLPRAFGGAFSSVEQGVYFFADKMIPGYNGGYWEFVDIEIEDVDRNISASFLCIPGFDSIHNPFSGELVGDTDETFVGMIVTIYSLNYAFEKTNDEKHQDAIVSAIDRLKDVIYLYAEARGYKRQAFVMLD